MGTGTTTGSVGQWKSCLECEHVMEEQDDIVMHADQWDRVKRMDGAAVAALLPHAKHQGQWVTVKRSYRVCEFDGMPLLPVENNCPHAKAIERKLSQQHEQPQNWWEQ